MPDFERYNFIVWTSYSLAALTFVGLAAYILILRRRFK